MIVKLRYMFNCCMFFSIHLVHYPAARTPRSSCATCPWTLSHLKPLLLSIRQRLEEHIRTLIHKSMARCLYGSWWSIFGCLMHQDRGWRKSERFLNYFDGIWRAYVIFLTIILTTLIRRMLINHEFVSGTSFRELQNDITFFPQHSMLR